MLDTERLVNKVTKGASAPIWLTKLLTHRFEGGMWQAISQVCDTLLSSVLMLTFIGLGLWGTAIFFPDFSIYTEGRVTPVSRWSWVCFCGFSLICVMIFVFIIRRKILPFVISVWQERNTRWWVMGCIKDGTCLITQIYETELEESQNPFPSDLVFFNVPKNRFCGSQFLGRTGIRLVLVNVMELGRSRFILSDDQGNKVETTDLQWLSFLISPNPQHWNQRYAEVCYYGLIGFLEQGLHDAQARENFLRQEFKVFEKYFGSDKTNRRDLTLRNRMLEILRWTYHVGHGFPSDFSRISTFLPPLKE